MDDLGIAAYEGLVFKTSHMFAAMVGLEPEDMQQELRLKIIKSKRVFDPARSSMSERAYIYSCVANLVKDLKRNAATRYARVGHIGYIETLTYGQVFADGEHFTTDHFMLAFLSESDDQTFAAVLDRFTFPSTVTQGEQEIAALLVAGFDQQEIGELMGLSRTQVTASVKKLREKLADWQPSRTPESDTTRTPGPGRSRPARPVAPTPRRTPAAPVAIAA
jgi:RNA polymerase sigma factor (sigma-70 family)